MKHSIKCFGQTVDIDTTNSDIKLVPITEDLSEQIYDMYQEIPYREEFQDVNIANGLSRDTFRKYCAMLELAEQNILLSYIEQQTAHFVLFDGNFPIGWFLLRTENLNKNYLHSGHIGYTIRPSKRKQGYATKGLAQIIQLAKALGYKQICVTTDDQNTPSKKLIAKFGFTPFPADSERQQITKSAYKGMSQYYLDF